MQSFRNLSKQPEEYAKRSKKAPKSNIEQQSQPEPIDKQDPTQLVKARDMTKGSRST
jgi:hypothetical protein